MLTYLACIEKRKQLQSPGKLQLIALRGANGLWTRYKDTVTFTSDRSGLYEGVLVLVTLGGDKQRQVLSIESAQEAILQGLVNMDLKRQWDEIEVWRNSLEYQRIEIEKRKMVLEKKEAECEELGALLKSQEEIVMEVFGHLKTGG